MADDSGLIQRVVADRDEEAFAERVRLCLTLVDFAALRQMGGDVHRAEDGGQTIFARPARMAPSPLRHQMRTA